MSLQEALAGDNLLCYETNGVALPGEHGVACGSSLPLRRVGVAIGPAHGTEPEVRADVPVPSSLPRALSSFVGREDVLAALGSLLDRSRLLTLTGPGGSGKTRLSIELASRVAPDYPDGVHFVPLATIRDPALVPSAIARSLGLQDSRGRPLVEHLADYLGERRLLLVLDNFEQLLSGAPAVAELLAAGSGPRVVVTSRSPLHLSGEQEFMVPPLPVPDVGADVSPAALAACEST